MLHSELSSTSLLLASDTRGRVGMEIVYETFPTEPLARWDAVHNNSSCDYHERAGWWWKSPIRPLPQSVLHKVLVLVVTTRRRVGGGNPL